MSWPDVMLILNAPCTVQVHILGICCSHSSPWSCEEWRWLQTRQAAHIQGQPLHRFRQVSRKHPMKNAWAAHLLEKLNMYLSFFNQVHEYQRWMGNSREAAFQRFCECIILFAIKVIFARFKLKFYIFPCITLWKLCWLTLYAAPCREICATGLRTQTVGTSTVWSTKQERGRPFSITTLRTQSYLKRERWAVGHSVRCSSSQVRT